MYFEICHVVYKFYFFELIELRSDVQIISPNLDI